MGEGAPEAGQGVLGCRLRLSQLPRPGSSLREHSWAHGMKGNNLADPRSIHRPTVDLSRIQDKFESLAGPTSPLPTPAPHPDLPSSWKSLILRRSRSRPRPTLIVHRKCGFLPEGLPEPQARP